MKATRTKRMAGFAGLLMALTLTVTGCQMIPNANLGNADTKTQPTPVAPPVKKVSDFDPAKVTLGEEWIAAFGEDRAVSTPVATAGLKILSVMFDEHPNYTLGSFVPTDKEWSATVADFKPLVNAKAMQYMESEWNADKTLPVMTSYRSKPDKDGVHGYTYTTEAGEKCTDGDKPYEYKNEAVTLIARPDEAGNTVPVFSSNVSVTVHCKEGGYLTGQMFGWFPMQEVNGKWVMLDLYEVNPAGHFKIMQVVDGT